MAAPITHLLPTETESGQSKQTAHEREHVLSWVRRTFFRRHFLSVFLIQALCRQEKLWSPIPMSQWQLES